MGGIQARYPTNAWQSGLVCFPMHAVVAGLNYNEAVLYVERVAIDGQMVPGFFGPTGFIRERYLR